MHNTVLLCFLFYFFYNHTKSVYNASHVTCEWNVCSLAPASHIHFLGKVSLVSRRDYSYNTTQNSTGYKCASNKQWFRGSFSAEKCSCGRIYIFPPKRFQRRFRPSTTLGTVFFLLLDHQSCRKNQLWARKTGVLLAPKPCWGQMKGGVMSGVRGGITLPLHGDRHCWNHTTQE